MIMKKLIFVLILAALLFFADNCGRSAPSDTKKNEKKDTNTNTNAVKTGKANKTDKNGKKTLQDEKKKTEDTEKDVDTDAVPVQVINPSYGDISSSLLFSSNVDAEQIVDIYPMTSGIIEKILHDEGDHIKKGDVLAVLDDREAVINEKRAHINYQQLKMEFERQKAIFEKNMISKDEHEKLKFRMQTAKLDWEHYQLLLSYTRISSPISGVVTKRYIKIGNKINISQLAFSVVQDKEKIAVVNIPEQEFEQLFLKQKAVVIAGPKKVKGFVKRISPAIDPESGTFKVTVAVKDDKNILAVGQFINVKIIKKVHENVILLTKDALLYEGGKVFVFVVNDENKALKKQVKLGFEESNVVEITEGLSKKERVVTAGKSSLKNDTLVKIVEPITT